MKSPRRLLCLLTLLVSTAFPSHVFSQLTAFPSAEGFGRFAQGGRGGVVIYVDNLNASGAGSFQACLLASGPRTCIFRVGGIIDWPCESCYGAIPPYLTIAGQTAPGDGIMLKNMQLQMRGTHNVIIRHIRVRPGRNVPNPGSAGGLEIFGFPETAHDIIIDHCSVGWTPDDAAGALDAYNVTYQWTLISEGIGNGGGDPSKVMLWTPGVAEGGLSILHNLFAHFNYRAPLIGAGRVQMVNTVVYNIYGTAGVYNAENYGPLPIHMEVVNNYFLMGPNSDANAGTSIDTNGCNSDDQTDSPEACAAIAASAMYLSGNFHNTRRPNNSFPETAVISNQKGFPFFPISATPLAGSNFPVIPSQTNAQQARTDVLAKVGATVPIRDSHDTRAVNNVINVSGSHISDEAQIGGYGTYNTGTPYTDTDGDGMSDAWETAHGLNPSNPADGNGIAANGYTNLENFLNELAGDFIVVGGPALPPPTNFRLVSP